MVEQLGRRAVLGRVVLGLLVAQILFAVIGAGAWRWTVVSAPAVPPLVVADGWLLGGSATLESGLPVALKHARAWQADAQLLSATMQVDWPWSVPPAGELTEIPGSGWLTYVFVAPWQPSAKRVEAASLSVVVNRLSGAAEVMRSLGWEEAPVFDQALGGGGVSATEALLAAESAGGTGFRRACPINRHLSRVALIAGGGRGPEWLVTYRDERKPERHGFSVRVDAATGDLRRIGGEAEPCEDTTQRFGPRF